LKTEYEYVPDINNNLTKKDGKGKNTQLNRVFPAHYDNHRK